MIVTIKDK